IKESLTGERMASFLPLVRELSDEYDPQAIAAAALQMIYDQDCPEWMKTDWEVPESSVPKPIIKRKGKYNSNHSKHNGNSNRGNRKIVSHQKSH
nr:ATP-dependent helicase [Crocosphaera sp.]